ncbi:unnamed protein product [Alternaria alternata]
MNATPDGGLPSKAALLSAMSGVNSTSNWDVLVSYSVTQLNALLPSLWKKDGKTFTNVTMNFDYETLGLRMAGNFDIGAPTLQFITGESSQSQLTMSLQGSIRKDTLVTDDDTGAVTVTEGGPKDTTSIPPGLYQIIALVPLASMDGNALDSNSGKAYPSSQRVVFGDLNTKSCKIIFHFKSENSKYTVQKIPGVGDHKKVDQLMSDFSTAIQNYFLRSDKINSLDYALASVQQTVNHVDEGRVLHPESFIFRTQGSAPGVLCVYIKTNGSGNDTGFADPHFQPGNQSVLPIPQGHTASIIIRHELFNEKYLFPQLQSQTSSGGLVKENGVTKDQSFLNGFKYYLRMAPGALVSNKLQSKGPWSERQLRCAYQFDNPPLTLTISNGVGNWFWQFSDYRYDWSRDNKNEHGKVYFDVNLNATYPVTSVTDKDIAFKVNLTHEDFRLWVHPYYGNILESMGAGWTNYLPLELNSDSQLFMDINALQVSNQDFNFFATQNVFAPGQQIISVDNTEGLGTPHDILLVGHVVEPLPPASSAPVATDASKATLKATVNSAELDDIDQSTPADSTQSLPALKTALFTDQIFVKNLFAALRDGKADVFEQLVSSKGIKVSEKDLKSLQAEASTSPSFDIRLAGGLYKIDAPTAMKDVTMTISPMDGMISFNNAHVENQNTDQDTGKVHWTTGNGSTIFEASFATKFGNDGNISSITITGQKWTSDQPTNTTLFSAFKVIPGPATSGSDGDTGGWFASTAVQGVSFVLTCVGFTGLTVASVLSKVNEWRKKRVPGSVAPDVLAAQAIAQHASAVAESIVHAAVAERPVELGADMVTTLVRNMRREALLASNLAVNAAGGAVGDHAAMTTSVVTTVKNELLADARRFTQIELVRRFPTLSILPDGGHGLIREVTERLVASAVRPEFEGELATASVTLARATQKATTAIERRIEAVQALMNKSTVAETLRSEQNARVREIAEIEVRDKSGQKRETDDTRKKELELEILAKTEALVNTELEVEHADAAKEEAKTAAEDALTERAEAKTELDRVEPRHERHIPVGR